MTAVRSNELVCVEIRAVRGKRLSFRTRGLHHFLLGYSDQTFMGSDTLSSFSGGEGQREVDVAIERLKSLGYACVSPTDEYLVHQILFGKEGDRDA